MKQKLSPLGLALIATASFSYGQEKVTVGEDIGKAWDGLPVIQKGVVPQVPPLVSGVPNYSKYPIAAGPGRGAFTKNIPGDMMLGERLPLRSWVGWFLWGDGVTPPGINPGIYSTAAGYGKYAGKGWDFFNFQWPQAGGKPQGSWNPIRLDQQPLFLTPLTVNYNWAPALFGFESKPLLNFPNNAFYWKDKRIVRGVNVGGSIPFFYQYGDKLTAPIPEAWRQSWMYLATRPLETTVIVPSNEPPKDLTNPDTPGANWVPKKNGSPDPFPYPVWRTGSTPLNQTPFAILVDKVGDFHADLIWEATNAAQSDYDTFRYKRTPFSNVSGRNPMGTGDYLKMTVAKGSPFVWCEVNDSTYAIFYNLIRTNIPGEIANNLGTGASVLLDGPYDVPQTQGVKFVLLYGDHVNPNQWYQENPPWFATIGAGPDDSNLPGGFNPPPLNGTYRAKNGSMISTNGQHNYVYTAIFYRPDQVDTVNLKTVNSGTDSQGNPYFYLKFKNPTGKNWFVVGSVPEMRYYGVSPDGDLKRKNHALDWAKQMGKYAFNFVTDTKVNYTVTNMYQTETTYQVTMKNPYVELPSNARPINAAAMTKPGTVLALQPHQYQPITLGPDYTKTNKTQVVWNPLKPDGITPFVNFAINISANKNVKNGLSFWDYWSTRGSLKSYVTTGSFKTVYPFQNFLPVMPPPKFDRTFDQTGIAAINVTGTGTGYQKITDAPTVTISTTGTTPGQDGKGLAIVDQNTGQVQQVNVTSAGTQYPDGIPPAGVDVTISPPTFTGSEGRQATAYAQAGGGNILAIFMKDKGFGYSSIITATQESGTSTIDPPIITPNFDSNGNLVTGPANVLENGAGFNFSSSITVKLFSGTGSGATLQIVKPGSILGYSLPVSGGSQGRYASPDGAAPTGVSVHVTPPEGGGPAQQATAEFFRKANQPVPSITNGGEYSNTGSLIAYYTNENGVRSNNLAITFSATGTNQTVTGLSPGNLTIETPRPIIFEGGTAITPAVAVMNPLFDCMTVVTRGGDYSGTAGVTASFVDDAGATINLTPTWQGASPNFFINSVGATANARVTTPKPITFSGGTFTTSGSGTVYPTFAVSAVHSGTNLVGGYEAEPQVSFTGGAFSTDSAVGIPVINFQITGTKSTITPSDLTVVNSGSGIPGNTLTFMIEGGLGFDAVLDPIVNATGKLIAVRVLKGGSNYLPEGKVFGWVTGGGGTGAVVDVDVVNGSISAVKVTNSGTNYTAPPSVQLVSKDPSQPPNPDPVFTDNPKGVPSKFNAVIVSGSLAPASPFIKIDKPNGKEWANYYAGSENTATRQSVPSSLAFEGTPPFATYTSAKIWFGLPAPTKTQVAQVLYSSVIDQFYTLASANVAPFGGAYLGKSAPDGYGLGGQLGGTGRFIGDIYNMQQMYPTFPPETPSAYAVSAGRTPYKEGDNKTWEYPVQQENNPYISLTGALKSSVQSLQRSVSLLFIDPPSHNNPGPLELPNTWRMDYFSLFDPGVGRMLINPTATQPAWGVNSFTDKPGDIPDTPDENGSKPVNSLSRWNPGMLWSGFGVSDQWNDQHYFYGYYLGAAALSAVFDRAWLTTPSSTGNPPADLWAGKAQMGAGIDQLLMTLAYDPDNTALQDPINGFYKISNFTYQKFSFFDQWSGHPWATGGTPGTTVAVLDFAADPFGFWRSFGTDSDKYNGENENSAFEGIQAWSSAIIWGGATDRKAIVDLGIYLYSTNLAAADAYFLDKNYNMVDSANNKYSWVPVTTINASQVPKNGENDLPRWNAGADYTSANPEAFFTAPQFFGDVSGTAATAGQSLTKKVENTLNNFFYAYPTGSKFIQAYPPAAWTMGISRNTNFMKKWAGAMMRQEWNDARNSALYQPADWNAMALTSALSGVPYNPGDLPYPLTGTAPNTKKVEKYLPRLWSSWVTTGARPGAKASLNPPFLANSVLTFLLALDDYGTPDWTYIGVATGAGGAEDNNSVVFTAAFTKEPNPGDTTVTTTFVAFNPGWSTRYVKFQRLGPTGDILPANVLPEIPPIGAKKTYVKTLSFPIGN